MTQVPTLSGAALEQAIADRPFEKVTKDSIEARMMSVNYFTLPDTTVTVCNITMANGFSFRGESACVDPRNYDREIGESLAYKDAFGKIWAFEGYLLAERRYQMTQPSEQPSENPAAIAVHDEPALQ